MGGLGGASWLLVTAGVRRATSCSVSSDVGVVSRRGMVDAGWRMCWFTLNVSWLISG
ncbi:MAG: hypothetical protein ACTSWP_01600 [Candidatus Freyarchaeota archaeon]|nr:hypothetical protein [Candidatus Freyrarchaeum guaymaensis]